MKIGYARVSSITQDIELQKEALERAGCSAHNKKNKL